MCECTGAALARAGGCAADGQLPQHALQHIPRRAAPATAPAAGDAPFIGTSSSWRAPHVACLLSTTLDHLLDRCLAVPIMLGLGRQIGGSLRDLLIYSPLHAGHHVMQVLKYHLKRACDAMNTMHALCDL